jgi:glutamate-1-semialdehyde aminotransferase
MPLFDLNELQGSVRSDRQIDKSTTILRTQALTLLLAQLIRLLQRQSVSRQSQFWSFPQIPKYATGAHIGDSDGKEIVSYMALL